MIERLFLHIGSDKAGSSAIQEALVANRLWYLDRGVALPEAGLSRGGFHQVFSSNSDESITGQVFDELRTATTPCGLLSWEGIHFYGATQRQALRQRLRSELPGVQIEVIFYLRNQIDLIQSGLLQQVKQGALLPQLIADMSRPYDELGVQGRHHVLNARRKFHQTVVGWQRDLPDADMTARLYDRSRLVNGDIVADFNECIGVAMDDQFARPTHRANTSLSVAAASLCAEVLAHVWDPLERERVIDAVTALPSLSTSFLHASTREEITKHYASDNRKLVRAHPGCAGIEIPRSSPPGDSEPDRRACRDAFAALTEYPTLMKGRLAGEDLGILASTGWKPTPNGLWLVDDRAALRFRPRAGHFGSYAKALRVEIKGRYARSTPSRSHLIVNGQDHGTTDLSAFTVDIPLDQLGPTQEVDIQVKQPRSARAIMRTDPGSFLLRSVSYWVLQP